MRKGLFCGLVLAIVLMLAACGGDDYYYIIKVYDYSEELVYDEVNQPVLDPAELLQEVENGFFDYFAVYESGEIVYFAFEEMVASAREDFVWAKADLRGDGTYQLVMEAQSEHGWQRRRIISIFAVDFESREMERVFHHNAGLRHFWFLGFEYNVVRVFSGYGSDVWWHGYALTAFDEDWEVHDLETIVIEYAYEKSQVRFFKGNGEQINRERFWGKFREFTGWYSSGFEPEWYIHATTFVSIMRVHEDMPNFIVYRTIDRTLEGEWDFFYFGHSERYYVEIRITDEDGNLLQVLTGFWQGGDGGHIPSRTYEVRFEDLNFNGYMDMWLFEEINRGTAAGAWHFFWLWNPEKGQFVRNEQLREITEMGGFFANQDTRQMGASSRGGGAGPWNTTYYEYVDGDFVAVSSVHTEWARRDFVEFYMQITHTNLITGEVVIEFDPPEAAPDFTFIKVVDINPNMEFPTHEVRLDMWRLP